MLPGVLFLTLFLFVPTLQMFGLSVTKGGAFTSEFFAKAFGSATYLRVLKTTFSVAMQVSLYCVLLGYPLAYWIARLSGRGQRIAIVFVLLPFWTSALIKNFSWMVLLGRNGVVASVFEALSIPGGDRLLFHHATVVFAMTHTMLPLAVVTMLPVMNQIDRQFQAAATTLGAGRAEAFWRIYAPLSMRGVAAAMLLVFVASLGFFITPALLGGPQQTMIGQLIIMQINDLQNWSQGSALAVMLVVSALASCFVFDRVFGISSVAAGSGGGTHHAGPMRRLGLAIAASLATVFAAVERWWGRNLKGLRGSALLTAYAILAFAVLIAPIAGFIPMAFTDSAFLSFPPPGYSLKWFEAYAQSPLWLTATVRSFAIALATASITLVIGSAAAFGLARSASRLSSVAFLMFMTPLIIPPIVIAVSLFYLFAQLSLIATDLGIIIGHAVIAMPIVFVILLATFKGYRWQLDDVARTLGAGRWATLRRVTLPLVAGGLAAGFVTGFLQSFEELTVALFIGGGLKTTLPKQMWDSILLQVTPTIAAASVVVLVIVLALFLLLELTRRDAR